jgi:hypothetical protein
MNLAMLGTIQPREVGGLVVMTRVNIMPHSLKMPIEVLLAHVSCGGIATI